MTDDADGAGFHLPQNRRWGRAYLFILPLAAALAALVWGATGALWDPPLDTTNNNLLVASGLVVMGTFFGAAQSGDSAVIEPGVITVRTWTRETVYRKHEFGGVVVKGIGHLQILLLGDGPRFVSVRWTPTRLSYYFSQDDPTELEQDVTDAYGGDQLHDRAQATVEKRTLGWRLAFWGGCVLLSPVPFLIGSALWWLLRP